MSQVWLEYTQIIWRWPRISQRRAIPLLIFNLSNATLLPLGSPDASSVFILLKHMPAIAFLGKLPDGYPAAFPLVPSVT